MGKLPEQRRIERTVMLRWTAEQTMQVEPTPRAERFYLVDHPPYTLETN
jgi:hypothetical protein